MKTLALFLSLFVGGICLLSPVSSRADSDPAVEASQPVAPDLTDLRQKLDAVERSSRDAAERFDSLVQQNTTLSNVLTGLQQTLVSQREREVQLGQESNSFNLKVIAGAATAVFLVLLLSYWFQLKCLNRVMELSSSLPIGPGHSPALLENERSQASSLLAAIKVLENRIQHLELPGNPTPTQNGTHEHAQTTAAPVAILNGTDSAPASPSSVSLLLAKGQTLLDMDRLSDALFCFQEAAILEPANSEAHFRKGIALERLNRLEPALGAYEEAVRLNPKRATAHAYKARVLTALHRYDEAVSVYDSALEKNGNKTATPMFTN